MLICERQVAAPIVAECGSLERLLVDHLRLRLLLRICLKLRACINGLRLQFIHEENIAGSLTLPLSSE